MLAVFALLAVALARPAAAEAYTVSNVDIKAQVQTDGSLQVAEARRFEFDDGVNGVYWDIPLGNNEQGAQADIGIESVQVADDGEQARDFQWADYASNGQDGVYLGQYVEEDGRRIARVKVYTPHESGEAATVTLRYTMTGAVMAWDDTAELYWQFVGSGWAEDSDDVRLTVSFAGAVGQPEPAKEAFRAWAHGPLTGTVTPHRSERTVDFQVPVVHAGEFAEARIAFPTAWVPGLTATGGARLDAILEEERGWAEEANAQREQARATAGALTVAQAGVPAAFLGIMAFCRARVRKPKPVFQETYFRDVPSADHPAVIAAFMHGGTVGDEAFISTLMKLTDDKVIELKPWKSTSAGFFGGKKTKENYTLRVKRGAYEGLTSPIDRAALDTYFEGVSWKGARAADGRGADADPGTAPATPAAQAPDAVRARTFEGLKSYAEKNAGEYRLTLENYQSEVKAALEQRNLVASSGVVPVVISVCVGVLLLAGLVLSFLFVADGTGAGFGSASLATFIAGLAMTLGGIALGFTFKRYTQEGAELRNRCRALKKWLEDFTRLGEAVPSDLILWNKLLVYAVALGVSDEVLRQLADAVPPEQRVNGSGGYCYPVYWWCYPHASLGSPIAAMHGAYSVGALAATSDSSSAGFGGGFSGGGGGGVGGGGGGTF